MRDSGVIVRDSGVIGRNRFFGGEKKLHHVIFCDQFEPCFGFHM